MDGGIRRGANVLMALALGADAVLLGRHVTLALFGGQQARDLDSLWIAASS